MMVNIQTHYGLVCLSNSHYNLPVVTLHLIVFTCLPFFIHILFTMY